MVAESEFDLTNRLPLRAGWYRLTVCGLSDLEAVELRLDFGLGFVGHHAVRATAVRGEASLFVRLFKPLRAIQLLRRRSGSASSAPSRVAFEPVPRSELWARRVAEQFHLLKRALPLLWTQPASRHDKPRRLWDWRGLQAFPSSLPAKGESSYALYRQLNRASGIPRHRGSLKDWLIVVDCRFMEVRADCVEACAAAAAYAGARVHLLHDGDLNAALEQAGSGIHWVAMVEPDIALDEDCVAAFAEAASASESAALYSDSDHQDEKGRRFSPQFRTSFSLERLRSEDWLGGVLAFRTDVVGRVSVGASSIHALSLALAEELGPNAFEHVSKVLYSRRSTIRSAMAPRRRAPATWSGSATVIIPTRNRADLLQRCVDSILARSKPCMPQVIIHDNGSDDSAALALLERYAARDGVRVFRDEGSFNFSRINNEAAAIADGELLVFLNNDTEVVSADWIQVLGEAAAEPSVGCAGPLLLRPDGKIQHAGLVTGTGGIAAHIHEGLDPDRADRVAPIVRRDVSALTGACLAIQKSKFLSAGGFDAEGLPVAFNDVDLCLRLERQGLRNVFVPEATLTHVGSATRENDDFTTGSDRFRAEFALMRERWGERLDADPYFPKQLRLTPNGPQLRLA